MKIHKVKTVLGITDIEKTVTVRIDDVDLKVEPDTGADVNVMDENQFYTVSEKKIRKSSVRKEYNQIKNTTKFTVTRKVGIYNYNKK